MKYKVNKGQRFLLWWAMEGDPSKRRTIYKFANVPHQVKTSSGEVILSKEAHPTMGQLVGLMTRGYFKDVDHGLYLLTPLGVEAAEANASCR